MRQNENLRDKEKSTILKITKREAEFIAEHAKEARITVVGRKKKARRKSRYVDESSETLRLLDEFRRISSGVN